jgi:glycosyltransferase involved in cell wall biosynthesis
VFDNQCLGWGLLGIRATGVPVVSVIHHPLHIDREADFAIDPSLIKKIKRTLYFPLFMQQQVAPRLDRIVTVSEASRAEIERYFGIPEKEIRVVYNGTDSELFHPVEVEKDADLLFVGPHRGPQEGPRHAARGDGAAARVHAQDRRRPDPDDGLVMRYLRRTGIGEPRDPAPRACSRSRSWCASTPRRAPRWCRRSSRASASRRARRWRAGCP